jgi:hypothetical protein
MAAADLLSVFHLKVATVVVVLDAAPGLSVDQR